jgi:DNA-binding PadR family transcriptional regulator
VTEPLSEAVFQILLALSDRPRHGLGVAEEVESRTAGRVSLGASTLYTAFGRMLGDGWIREVQAPTGEADARRRFYALTPAGRRTLRDEARRLETLVRDARGKAVLPGERPA